MVRIIGNAKRLPFMDESFDTVITDPPWKFERRVSSRAKAVKATNFPLLSWDEIYDCLEEIRRVMRPGGYLLLFVPPRLLPLAFKVCKMFDYVGNIVWDKQSFGLGHYFRGCHENILVFSKGKPRRIQNRSTRSILVAKNPGQSRKPPSLYQTMANATTPSGGRILDPFCGSDPLSNISGFETISLDIRPN